MSVFSLKREAFPTIDFDMVVVQTIYPGATPEEVEKFITNPIEIELKQVDDIDEMTSTSSEGRSSIVLKINPDSDNKDKVINDIQKAVDRVTDLPSDLEDEPLVTEVTTKNQPTISLSIWGDLSEKELQTQIKILEDRLLENPYIAKIRRDGWREPEMQVEVDLEALKNYYIGLEEIIFALNKHNVSIPGGSLIENGREYIIRTSGEFDQVEDIENVVIRSTTTGQLLRIKDVASVREDFEREEIINKTNGQKSINLTVIRKESGDTITVVENTKQIVNNFLASSSGLHVHYYDDFSFFIQRRIGVLRNNGIVGIIFVVLSLFFFLSFRVAIGTCISIPIVICITFSLMNWFGVSINLLSLFGLIMVLGMIVDEDIVVAENIFRHLEMGKSPREATIEGASEISRAVIATVATTIAAFIPLYMMAGTTGKFVRNIPQVVNFTLIASLVVALFILPSHLYYLTKNLSFKTSDKKSKVKEFFNRLIKKYEVALRFCVNYRYIVILFFIVLLVGSLLFAKNYMKYVMFPSGGVEKFSIKLEGNLGDPLEITDKKLSPIISAIQELPKNELENFITKIGILQSGSDDSSSERGPHLAQINIFLTPISKRERVASDIIEDLRTKIFGKHEFEKISFEIQKAGPPVGQPIQIGIKGNDLKTLREIAKQATSYLENQPGLLDVSNNSQEFIYSLNIDVDLAKAAQAHLNISQIATNVRAAFEGTAATVIKSLDEDIDVVVKLPEEARYNFEKIGKLLIKNNSGKLIPLSKIASFHKDKTLRVIKHENNIKQVLVSANINEKKTDVKNVISNFKNHFSNFDQNYPNYSFSFLGEQKENQESMASLKVALYISLSLIFIILVTMFRSLLDPLIILSTIPFGVIGVIWCLKLHSMPLSFMSLLGVVALTGVIANSAIIVIDFIQKARESGLDKKTSIIEGAKVRLRPVILTSLTTALGVIPAAYGIGGSDPFIQPMALTLNYGLVFGSTLSLFFVPCAVAIVDDLSLAPQKIKKLINRKKYS